MKTFNRFISFTKRILARRLYICMLATIIIITALYRLLPDKKSSADIMVALYCIDDSYYSQNLLHELISGNSLYTFYVAHSEEEVINDVKSGYAECGYVIPADFFEDYVKGIADTNQIRMYKIPSTMLGATICETIFSSIFKLCAEDILLFGVDIPEYNHELSSYIRTYMSSDSIFRISDTSIGEFSYENMVYHINLPTYEIIVILIIFSGLLGLLIYMQDAEKGIYLALSGTESFSIRCMSIATAILPMLAAGIISSIVTSGFTANILNILLCGAITFISSILLGAVIRKSTSLIKVLPIITLLCIITVFVQSLM